MHTGPLAFEANAGASVGFMVLWISLIFCIVRWHLPYWIWLLTVWAAMMCGYFGLIAVSAGPAPMFTRDQMALGMRLALLVADGFLFAGLACLVGMLVRRGRVTTSATFRLALFATAMLMVVG